MKTRVLRGLTETEKVKQNERKKYAESIRKFRTRYDIVRGFTISITCHTGTEEGGRFSLPRPSSPR